MAILSSKSFELSTPQTRARKGPLVRVEISPGRYVKMHETDAVARGYIKARPPAGDKVLKPAGDKTVQGSGFRVQGSEIGVQGSGDESQNSEPKDDFTIIAGVGPATARALQARGIVTFEQLRQAGALDYVSAQAMQAIEQWRNPDEAD